MSVHICAQCGSKFEYCRACVFRPIAYKDKGFCSKECYEASKNKVEEVIQTKDVEVVLTDEDTSTPKEEVIEYPQFFTVSETAEVKVAKSKKRRQKAIDDIIEENNIDENKQDNGTSL